jgi:sodium/hydrogen exchange regulatory cofactor NHE-RF1
MYNNIQRPRLCHICLRSGFDGFGFNLHCDKTKVGQFIGKVEANSPAESAGLREFDRIIEVNFVPITNESHQKVVSRIKEGVERNGTKYKDEVILLVVDQETNNYYKSRSMPIKSSDPNIERIKSRFSIELGLLYQ